LGALIGVGLLILAVRLPWRAISESMCAWIALICSG
jgi:hypothetical protein